MAVFVTDERAGPDGDAPTVDLDRLQRLARHVLRAERVPAAMEVSVLCVDRAAIAALNERHMGKPGPTDVLAFPLDLPGESVGDQPAILGDVVICPAVAQAQAVEHGVEMHQELDLLVVHGILHLLGYDHAEPDEKAEMFGRTDLLLETFGRED